MLTSPLFAVTSHCYTAARGARITDMYRCECELLFHGYANVWTSGAVWMIMTGDKKKRSRKSFFSSSFCGAFEFFKNTILLVWQSLWCSIYLWFLFSCCVLVVYWLRSKNWSVFQWNGSGFLVFGHNCRTPKKNKKQSVKKNYISFYFCVTNGMRHKKKKKNKMRWICRTCRNGNTFQLSNKA